MHRREFLALSGSVGSVAVAGCTDIFETQTTGGEPPVLEDRPDAVYYPTHVEGMEMIGTAEAGDYSVGLAYTYPHRFWTVSGTTTERVEVESDDDVHLMATVWDGETNAVLPVDAGLSLSIERDGETVTELTPWTMLSQNMGFHYGDNVALEGDGTYAVTARIGSVVVRRFGAYEGRFGEVGTTEFSFEYSSAARDEITFERLSDREGETGAVEPMEMEMLPTSTVPAREDLPGRLLGADSSGDAVVVATAIDDPDFVDGDAYLVVSPRTPHNRFPLPTMALSATIDRGGETVVDEELRAGLHPELGYHYGTIVDGPDPGDAVTIAVDSPPHVSRHEGYETAFLVMPDVELTVD